MSDNTLIINEINAHNIYCGNSINCDGRILGQNDISTQYGDIICYRGNISCVNGIIFSNNFQNMSDHRLKENIEPLSEEYSIDRLKPCVYNFISDDTKRKHTGFLAHEVQEVLPHLVSGDAEDMQSVNYVELIAILTKEMQSLKAKFNALEAETAELKAEITELKQK